METLSDAAARCICPDSISNGRRQLDALLEPRLKSCRTIEQYRVIAIGLAGPLSIIAFLIWADSLFRDQQSDPLYFWISMGLAFVTLVSIGWYQIITFPKAARLVPNVFWEKLPSQIEQFLASAERAEFCVFENGNRTVPVQFFGSPWAPIFLSNHPDSIKIKRALFPGEYAVDWTVKLDTIPTAQQNAKTKNTKKRVSKIASNLTKGRTNKLGRKRHWFNGRLQDEYEKRKEIVVNAFEPRNVVRLTTLFEVMEYLEQKDNLHPESEPSLTIKKIVQETANRLTKRGERLGLHTKPTSTEWMEKIIGNGNSHPYSWVRKYLTQADFEPDKYQ